MTAPRVTVIDASPTQALLVGHALEQRGLTVVPAESLADGIAGLKLVGPSVVVLNLQSTRAEAVSAVGRIRDACPDVPLLLVGAPADLTHDGLPRGGRRVHILRGLDAEALAEAAHRFAGLPDARPSAVEVFRRARILVVDDSVTYREFLRLELEEAGCAVEVATGARQGLEMLEQGGFDCVIVDLVMPGIIGTELCEALDRARRKRGWLIDIVVHTSQDRDDLLIACLEAGADEFVGKSHSMDVLKVRLLTLLRRKFYVEDVIGFHRET